CPPESSREVRNPPRVPGEDRVDEGGLCPPESSREVRNPPRVPGNNRRGLLLVVFGAFACASPANHPPGQALDRFAQALRQNPSEAHALWARALRKHLPRRTFNDRWRRDALDRPAEIARLTRPERVTIVSDVFVDGTGYALVRENDQWRIA